MENLISKQDGRSLPLLSLNEKSSIYTQVKQPFHTTSWRWVALILMNLLLLGDYVVIDSPQALETQLKETLDLTTQQYSYLYSSWALPSIVIPLVGGYLTDYLGVRPTLILSSVVLTFGQLVYYWGAQAMSFGWMLGGRAIYALGTNPLNVAQIVLIYKWFQGRQIALAMAISSTTSCIGRALNSFATPKIYEATQNIADPILFGLVACVISGIICVIMCLWDRENDKRDLNISLDSSQEVEKNEKVSLSDMKYFKYAVWLLVLNFGITDGCFFSFNAFANDFYHIRYDFSNSAAGNIISVNYIIAAVSSVAFGFLIDKKGYRASAIMYSSLFGVAGFLFFFVVSDCPGCVSTVLPQIFFGLLIGINDAATFPSLTLILDAKYLGTGYGLFFVVQNFFMFILPPIAAFIKDVTMSTQGGFFWMLTFFFILSCLTTIESIALFKQDQKLERILDTYIAEEEEEELGGNSSYEEGESKHSLKTRQTSETVKSRVMEVEMLFIK